MTYQPVNNRFSNVFPLATLVLVDMRKANLSSAQGLQHSAAAGILHNCRASLAFARKIGWPVAFVAGSGVVADASSNEWIKGFEPQRMDALFERRSMSCYSSPYFAEGVWGNGGAVVFAGFLGRGGCLSTAADALFAGHGVTFLSDATMDGVSDRAFDESAIRLLRAFTKFDIRVLPTSAWMKTVEQVPAASEEQGLPA